jgi:hypothetical protein
MTTADPEKIKLESCEPFREVLDHYAEVPVTTSVPHLRNVPDIRNIKTLGDRAQKSLDALEQHKTREKLAPARGLNLKIAPSKNQYRRQDLNLHALAGTWT